MADARMVNGLDIEAITRAVLAQVLAATSPTPPAATLGNRRARRAFMHNTQVATAPTAAPINNGAAKRLQTRQARVLNTTAASVSTPNTETTALKVPSNVLAEARKYADALDAAWVKYKADKKSGLPTQPPRVENPNTQLTQAEVLDILGNCCPAIHKICNHNPMRGPWLWIPTVQGGVSILPKHPDVRAFLKWLGFEWCGGQKMWLHKVNHKNSGKFRPGTHDLKSELAPV